MALKYFSTIKSYSSLIRLYRSCAVCKLLKPQQIVCRYKTTGPSAGKPPDGVEQPIMYTPPKTMRRQTPRKTRRRKFNFVDEGGYILLIFPLTSFMLGLWQIRRREWKLGLIEKMEKRTTQNPIPLPENLHDLQDKEYRPVKVRGTYDYSKEVLIGPRSVFFSDPAEYAQATGKSSTMISRESGMHVVTPFKLTGRNETILVNRGWLTNQQVADRDYRLAGQKAGEMELVGLVRLNEKEVTMVPGMAEHSPVGGTQCYLYRNVDLIARHLDTAPVFLDNTEWQPWKNAPIGGQTLVRLRNEHLSYALTWFALAALTIIMWRNKFKQHNMQKTKIQSLMENYYKSGGQKGPHW